jgi:diaminopimelate epimerase
LKLSGSIPFIKASACGNDFIVIEAKAANTNLEQITRAICDRYHGVGADGVEWLYPSESAEIKAHLINSDGSYAEISGNGTRCVAACLAAEGGAEEIRIETGAGVKTCTLLVREGNLFRFRTVMGKPEVGQPFNVSLPRRDVRGVPVSLGNPHFVSFVETFPVEWQSIASAIQAQREVFPDGVNVEFVRVINDSEIEIRIFERGAGETMSSGTGSSATAAAAIAVGRAHGTVKVVSPGGPQLVSWNEELALDGPASIICQGEFYV